MFVVHKPHKKAYLNVTAQSVVAAGNNLLRDPRCGVCC